MSGKPTDNARDLSAMLYAGKANHARAATIKLNLVPTLGSWNRYGTLFLQSLVNDPRTHSNIPRLRHSQQS